MIRKIRSAAPVESHDCPVCRPEFSDPELIACSKDQIFVEKKKKSNNTASVHGSAFPVLLPNKQTITTKKLWPFTQIIVY